MGGRGGGGEEEEGGEQVAGGQVGDKGDRWVGQVDGTGGGGHCAGVGQGEGRGPSGGSRSWTGGGAETGRGRRFETENAAHITRSEESFKMVSLQFQQMFKHNS